MLSLNVSCYHVCDGGTMSAGLKRGSVVKHPRYGFSYVGAWQESPTKKDPDRKTISLHSLDTGKR
ncbi:hypothetical protein [Scytonema sp. PRP1]|uniref:hypothetical protein n=1 Tax=Scytonema sp. PRP1 TaxID=3120513 RepID=UPI002FCEC308